MSVCFYVPADEAGTSAESDAHHIQNNIPGASGDDSSEGRELQEFWKKVKDDIKKVNADDFKTQALPLARIKKIMKLDEEVKMISSEAPVLFAKAAEIFIHELTLRAWEHTENNRRRTLQRNDIAMAISKSDQFDFLIDIVPRHEVKMSKPRDDPLRPSSTSEHVTQPAQTLTGTQPQFIVQPCTQLLQQQSTASTSASATPGGVVTPQPVTLVQQVMSSGEIQQMPVHLSAQQLQMIRLQLQQNPNQSFIIQQTHQQPQIIQVSSQGQAQPQQLYLAQVPASNQEES